MDLSVVIPAYRSAEILPDLLERLVPVLESLGWSCAVIFVEDCSPDHTWAVLRGLQRQYPRQLTLF